MVRPHDVEEAPATAGARIDAPRVRGTRDSGERRESAAPSIRAPRDDAPLPESLSSSRAEPVARRAARMDEGASRRGDADFRLLPETPELAATRGPPAGGVMDDAAFARAFEAVRARLQRQLAARDETPTEVHVSIGRIEVVAAPPPPPPPPRKAPERVPAVSLEQYLASRARRHP
jgi:hypothetical protein